MQAMVTTFISMNTTGISPTKANPIGRTFPPLFTINLLEEEHIIEDLDDIEGMQITIQVISFFVCIIIAMIDLILYQIFKRCRYMHSIVKYCFPFLPISQLLRSTRCTDLFVEVTNLTKGNTVWAPFRATGYHPTQIRLSRQIPKENVHIDTTCFFFKTMHIDWDNTIVTGISGIEIEMTTGAKVSIFMDNDLTHINDDHFEINLVARLLNQIYVVPTPLPRYDGYDDSHDRMIDHLTPSASTGAAASAPPFSFAVS